MEFRGQATYPLGIKRLLVRVGDRESRESLKQTFLLLISQWDIILKCSTLNAIKVVVGPYSCLFSSNWMTKEWENFMGTKRWLENATM